MNIRLIATDMDGTLLNNDHTINPAAKKKLIQAQERGIHIVLISGRDSHSLMPYAKELEMDRHPGNYLSCLNGLVLYDLDTQQEQRLENLKLPAIETASDLQIVRFRGTAVKFLSVHGPHVINGCDISLLDSAVFYFFTGSHISSRYARSPVHR